MTKYKKTNLDLKLVILAGGLGSRLSEETNIKPKPLVEIGGLPIILHIMKYYSFFGIRKFVICLGYKGNKIKEFFINRYLDKKFKKLDLIKNKKLNLKKKAGENWEIEFIPTGLSSLTGARLRKIEKYVGDEFFFTYGDGLSSIPIDKTYKQFKKEKKIGLISCVKVTHKFGYIKTDQKNVIKQFNEKKNDSDTWINGGFGIFNKKIFKYIPKTNISFEIDCLPKLVKDKNLVAYKHYGFWKCMDTLKDKMEFEKIYKDNPQWKK